MRQSVLSANLLGMSILGYYSKNDFYTSTLSFQGFTSAYRALTFNGMGTCTFICSVYHFLKVVTSIYSLNH